MDKIAETATASGHALPSGAGLDATAFVKPTSYGTTHCDGVLLAGLRFGFGYLG